MFDESYRRLTQFFADVKTGYPIDPTAIFLLGFSMGTMMSYALSLTDPGSVKGIIANSGYIPEETDLKFQWDRITGMHFFVAHGLHDPVIPVQFARRARLLLEQANVDLIYREYPMAHQISEESLNDMSVWLTGILNARVKMQNEKE